MVVVMVARTHGGAHGDGSTVRRKLGCAVAHGHIRVFVALFIVVRVVATEEASLIGKDASVWGRRGEKEGRRGERLSLSCG